MRKRVPRYVDNDLPPEKERLSAADAEAIRIRCAREVENGIPRLLEAAPPEPPRRTVRRGPGDPTLYIGLVGQAFGLLHIFERTEIQEHLELARRYLDAAHESLDRSGFPTPEEWLSFHATGGISAVAAVVHDRLGDAAECRRHLETYRVVAERAADSSFSTEDLLWGRGGFLFGAAFLRARLGERSIPDPLVLGALEAMIETGRRHGRAHSSHLTPGPHGRSPLVYLNISRFMIECFARSFIGGRSGYARVLASVASRVLIAAWEWRYGLRHRYDVGLVHGISGNVYLMMHFPDLLRVDSGWIVDVRASLDCLLDYLDTEGGLLELLPSPYSDAFHARTKTPRFTDRVHWCNGTTGAVFVFTRAYELFRDEVYLDAARRAAEYVWKYGLLRKGNGICHGVAGNGYAFLTLYRATSDALYLDRALHFARFSWSAHVTREQNPPDRPWSLYEGRLGTLCYYQDCLDPERARFPAFEV